MTAPIKQNNTNTRLAVGSLVVAASTLVGIAMNEGYVGQAYQDSGKVQTIGFGETKGVKAGQTTTPVRALVQLDKSINEYAKGVQDCVQVPLYQYEFDSYVDVAYNVGITAFCHSPIVAKANAQDYDGACNVMLGWYVHDRQGHFVPGLVNRRKSEYATCKGQT